MKMIKIAINNAIQDYVINNDDKGLIIDLDYNVPFKSNKGHFKVNLENAITSWTIQEFKKFVSIIDVSVDPFQAASFTHDFIASIVTSLTKSKSELIGNAYIADRKDIDTFINRLCKFNDVLVNSYGIEIIEIDNPTPKYKKCIVYADLWIDSRHSIQLFDGYQFTFRGYTLQVYKDKNNRKKIIVPSCGLAINSFTGQIKLAHEYLQNIDFLSDPTKQDYLKDIEKHFIDLMNESGYELSDINKSIVKTYSIDIVNDTIKESEKPIVNDNSISIDRFVKRFNRIYNRLYNDDISGNADYSDKVRYFDNHIIELHDLLSLFNKYREDLLTSDRKCAAFIMTLEHYYNIGYDSAYYNNKVVNLAYIPNEVVSAEHSINNRMKIAILTYINLLTGYKAINTSYKAILKTLHDIIIYSSPIVLATGPGMVI